ncbi:Efflux pump membrane transporter BepG [compost metagenome]
MIPLILASGAGAEARKIMGMTSFAGMLTATLVGVVLVPGLFVIVEKYLGGKKKKAAAAASSEEAKP